MRLRFHSYELDTDCRELRRDGVPVGVPPRAFALLAYLAEHRHRLVPKAELLDRFWPVDVSEAALQKAISLARKAVADATVIQTHHGLGFRFVAPVLAVPDAGGGAAPPCIAERRPVAVLALRCAMADPARIETFLRAGKAAVETHGGCLLHLKPDGFTAGFGIEPACEDGTRRAAQCALALRGAAEAPELCLAVETGPLDLPGPCRPPARAERRAWALSGIGAPGTVILGAAARQLLHGEIRVTAGPDPGSWQMRGVPGFGVGLPARPGPRFGRFVGRDVEIAFLRAAVAQAVAGEGRAVLLTGPAGIGKSRLLAELRRDPGAAGVRQVTAQCLPRLRHSPGAPVRALCRALFGDHWPGGACDAVDAALAAGFLGQGGQGAALHDLTPQELRQRSHALLTGAVQHAARAAPLIAVIEDVHWADDTSLDALDALARACDGHRVLLLLTSRPDPRAEALTEATLALPPLGDRDSLAMVRDVPGLAPGAAMRLVQRAGGNPFFLEELALAAPTGTALPATVQAVISGRIGALDADLRQLVLAVAAIGPPADQALAAGLLGRPADALTPQIDALCGAGLLRRTPGGLVFRHMLILDAAYDMIAPSERARLHLHIARTLEAGADPVLPERLAWHWQEAARPARALPHWAAASRAALRRSARPEAVAFADAGLALLRGDSDDDARAELDLLLSKAPALSVLRGFPAPEVGAAYARARHLSARVGTPKTDIRALVGLWIHAWVSGDLTRALDLAEDLRAIAQNLPDPALSLQAHAGVGQVLVHRGQLAAATQALDLGLAGLDQTPPQTVPAQNAAVACACYALWAASLRGNRAAAARHLARAGQLRDLRENPYASAIHAALTSEHHMFIHAPEACLQAADRAVALGRAHDFPFWRGTGLVMRGWALGQLGDTAQGLAALERGIAIFGATGAGVQMANWHGLRAETLQCAGRMRDARDAAAHALRCAGRTGDVFFTPRIHQLAARLAPPPALRRRAPLAPMRRGPAPLRRALAWMPPHCPACVRARRLAVNPKDKMATETA
ncbi:AAA family ATPase [Citreicella sp. C3M06]|uniref:ATP-binding protein n=1 Tax=Citreicella sp. C3M06 TaxID=2841564 RepID=UPI001C0A014C|nr:AAA family ATPase [Citreicella sp. C3M06]MBU2961120.1 AAA family ATPase [Citreicella sp. C3M06]